MNHPDIIFNIAAHCDLVTLGALFRITRGLPPVSKWITPGVVVDTARHFRLLFLASSDYYIAITPYLTNIYLPRNNNIRIVSGTVFWETGKKLYIHDRIGWEVGEMVGTTFAGKPVQCHRTQKLSSTDPALSRVISALRAVSIIVCRVCVAY